MFTLAGAALASLLSLVLLPIIVNVLSDKAKQATSEPVLWASAAAKEPERGCLALQQPPNTQDRAAISLNSDVDAVLRRLGGVWTRSLSIDLSLRGGSGHATITGVDIRPRGKVRPAPSAALLCHPSAGTGPVPELTANLDATPPIVKIDGKRYGEGSGSVITVDEGEQIPTHLAVSISRGYMEFDIAVRYAHKDRASETLLVYDGDPKLKRPFRVTGAVPVYGTVFVEGSGYNEVPARKACEFLPLKGC